MPSVRPGVGEHHGLRRHVDPHGKCLGGEEDLDQGLLGSVETYVETLGTESNMASALAVGGPSTPPLCPRGAAESDARMPTRHGTEAPLVPTLKSCCVCSVPGEWRRKRDDADSPATL